jgi:long-chain acyl-CoA synthetase
MSTPPPDFPTLIATTARDDAPALSFYAGRSLARTLTYAELLVAVDRVAGRLAAGGIRRGERVALLSPNRLEVPVLMLALLRLGATVVPLNPTSPPADWEYILAHARATSCFRTTELAGQFLGASTRHAPIEGIVAAALADTDAPAPPPAEPLGDDLAVVLYTSGTTGRPKGVGLPQRALLANAWSMAENFGLRATTQFAVLPLYHAHAFGFGLMTALTTHGQLAFVDKFDPFAWAECVRASGATVASVVPTLLPALLQVKVTRDKVPQLRCLMVSSAPLSMQLASDFQARTQIPLVQGWGLSEYTNFACCMPPPDSSDLHPMKRDELMFQVEVPSVGRPLRGTEVKVVDLSTGAELRGGERGELCIRGHSTMLGYLDDADATARTIDADGWLHSGDEGYFLDTVGERWFFISGRIKEIIIRGGDKHSPIALERVLLDAVPELAGHLCILGFPHDMHGEEIGAYVEAEAATADARAKLAAAIDAMTVEQRPKVVLIGSAPIPRTHTGKVQRRKLLPVFEAYKACRGATKVVEL